MWKARGNSFKIRIRIEELRLVHCEMAAGKDKQNLHQSVGNNIKHHFILRYIIPFKKQTKNELKLKKK